MALIPLPNDHFAVTVPKGAKHIKYTEWIVPKVEYWLGDLVFEIDLPPGSYTIVGMSDKITEEQAGEICGRVWMANHSRWENYRSGTVLQDFQYIRGFDTALSSFRSLLTSLSLEASTTLIVKQNK